MGAFDELSAGAGQVTIWCGDMMVTTPGADPVPGELGVATTPDSPAYTAWLLAETDASGPAT